MQTPTLREMIVPHTSHRLPRNCTPKLAFGDFVFGLSCVFYKGFKAVRYPIEFLVLAFGKSRECGACGCGADFEQAVAEQVFDFEIGNFGKWDALCVWRRIAIGTDCEQVFVCGEEIGGSIRAIETDVGTGR